MKKKTAYLILAMAAVIGISVPSFAANSRNYADGTLPLKSKNTLKYSGADGKVELYADDLELLADKVVTIPDRVFDPDIYTHSHTWEYININEQTHTKHCQECGSDNDLTNKHTAIQQENTSISYNGNTYSGIRYTCECGYQWIKEKSHSYVYMPVDDISHSITCALDGTAYCSGLRAYEEEHVFGEIIADSDNMHHTVRCDSCGYEKTQECDYTDHSEVSEDGMEITWYCECGNRITEPYTDNDIGADADLDGDADQDAVSDPEVNANPDMDSDANPDADKENADSQSTETLIYVSNQDGTHEVMQGQKILKPSEQCTLIVDLDTYNDVTRQVTYTCEFCNYSILDVYEPDMGE